MSPKQTEDKRKVRILVVDDESVVREGIVAILALQSDIEVVGEATNGLQAMELARKAKPDVILLDMVMPQQDGLTTIPQLKQELPDSRILVLTSFAESDRVYQAIKTGALGYLLKDVLFSCAQPLPQRIAFPGICLTQRAGMWMTWSKT